MMIPLAVTVLVLVIFYLIWKYKGLPPGPWGIPIFGYLPFLDPKNPYVSLTDVAKKYGTVYGLSLGNVYTVVLTDPKIIKAVFSKDSTTGRAPLYLTHGIMNGYGLICAEGELWKEHRKFTFNCLRQLGATKVGAQRKRMESLIMHHCLDFVNYLGRYKENTKIDIHPALRHSLGSAVNFIIFGKSWDRDDQVWKWLQHLQEEGPKYIGIAGPLNFLPFFRWFFLYLAKYPSIQAEIRNEIEAVLQDRLPTIEDLAHLPLVEAAIMETMRIRPVVPVGLPHGTLQEIQIDGYTIPKGTMLVCLLWALHMDEKVWKDPHQFNPKRFINEEGKIDKPEHFMPFQIGKRMCVGDELGKVFVFLFGVTLLQKYSLVLTDKNLDLWGECGITLTPPDHSFYLTKINKNAS